ncbi:MAG: transketolase family protein, partial [Parcubacteria group bacterium]|nr:transketolase family protein [Parcubacteria group bacterium]
MAATRDGYGEALVALGEKNDKVVVLCGDLAESTRSRVFAETFPERFVEVGVAEQNLAGLAAGMAFAGYIPFMSSFAVFSPGRNWDQIRVSICYAKANVKIAGGHAGISVGPDGATHQAMEDIAITRVLPNMVVVVPADSVETKKAAVAIAEREGPAYVRFC